MSYSCFELSIENHIGHLKLCRADKFNSMVPEFWTELPAAVAEVEAVAGVRVLVISSSGQHFSSGMDLSVFQGSDALNTKTPLDRQRFRHLVVKLQQTFNCLEQSRLPVIAAIQGGCIGAGVDMVSACDFRFATESAFFCVQEINLAMMADLGTLQRLPKLMPEGLVRELCYTGERLTAERAKLTGLVNETFETHELMLDHVMAVAQKIAGRSPLAVAATKESLNYVRDHSVADALLKAADVQAAIFDTRQIAECFEAKKDKREPVFADMDSRVVTI